MRSAASFIHPRDEILQAIQRIYRYRMTTTSGGNLSIREENGDIWITPARLDKGSLRREDIVCVHADGTVVGPHRPSSELPFHQEIYRTRPDIHGIVHAHPVALVAFSLRTGFPIRAFFTRRASSVAGGCALRTAGSSAGAQRRRFRQGLIASCGESRRGHGRR
jgi:L-fuculose-phosphate aldolase